jgi:3-deoxy-D-manno-octulosonic-acid transferase
MIWLIYNVLFTAAFAVTLPYYFLRMYRRGGYRHGFAQRLGWYDQRLRRKIAERRRIWVHAVSVGEVSVALRFMEVWRRARPSAAFVLSTNTSTAHALAERSLHPDDVLVYFPVDLPPVVRPVINMIQPQMLVLTEGEWWPNLIRMVRSRGVPVVLINGRMSESSFRGYRRLRWLFSRVVRMVDLLCVQSQADADRLLALRADPACVHITGSAKYDAAQKDPDSVRKVQEILLAAGLAPTDTFLVGGSTWPGEEAILLDIYSRFKTSHPALRLVLVPRHAERRYEVMAEIRSLNLKVMQRSRMADTTPASEPPDVLLVDTTGELRHFYAVASVIFMGKSLTYHGGQNIIEPAAYGKPIVVGPNMENFTDVVRDFLTADAIIQVPDAEALSVRLGQLLSDGFLRQVYGERAAAVVERKRGSLDRTLDLVAGVV